MSRLGEWPTVMWAGGGGNNCRSVVPVMNQATVLPKIRCWLPVSGRIRRKLGTLVYGGFAAQAFCPVQPPPTPGLLQPH